MLTSAQTLVDNFNYVSNNLSSAIATQNTSLVSLTAGINQILTNIAQLNGQIQVIGASGGNTNELKDQLNQNIQNLAKQIGITYTQNSDGTTDVNYADGGGALALVTGSQAGSFSLTPVPPSSSNYTVNLTTAGSTTGPAAVSPASGTLGATLNLIDTVIPGYQSQVNALATNIATQVNNLQTSGVDQNGNTGANVLPLFSFNPATSGATIAVTSNFGPSNIAAEGIGPGPSFTPLGTGDSSNALAIADLANSSTMPGGQTFSDFYNSLVTQVGQDVQTSGNNVTQDPDLRQPVEHAPTIELGCLPGPGTHQSYNLSEIIPGLGHVGFDGNQYDGCDLEPHRRAYIKRKGYRYENHREHDGQQLHL